MDNVLRMLTEIFEVCIIPLLGILTAYAVKYIQVKSEQISQTTESMIGKKYVSMLSDTITTCVIATNQTYVESLKKQGKFDMEAQRKAFQMTLDSVLNVLNDDARKYLTEMYGDLNTYIVTQIESVVNSNKIEIK